MAVIPKKAATVILLRDKEPEGFEVFLLKRHEKSSFMGGSFVYPGGRVERSDGDLEICPFSQGITPDEAHRILGGSLPPDESFAHWVAGVRELFEEAGVLLAYDQRGNPYLLRTPAERERFLNHRNLLQKNKLTICQLVQEENILLAMDQLHYYAHWITPEARSERFDARFFLARHPAGQEATFDQKETTAGVWLTPREALEENLRGDVILSPPTFKTLEDISRFKSIEDVLNSLKKQIQPVHPILTKISGNPLILFPWDPEYEIFRKGEFPSLIDHGRPSRSDDHTTRLIHKEGRWVPYCRLK